MLQVADQQPSWRRARKQAAHEGALENVGAVPKPSAAGRAANELPPKPPPPLPPMSADGPKGFALGREPVAAGDGANMFA